MKAKINTFLQKLIRACVRHLSEEHFIRFVLSLVTSRMEDKKPAEALKLLFTLDVQLYAQQGFWSAAYDGGIHTKHRHMKYHDFFTSRIKKEDHVMDIGCGIGAVAYDVSKIAARVVGMDFNTDSIQTARVRYQNPNLTFLVGDALIALPEKEFSVVILSNVLEHLQGRPEFLRRVQETLNPERILIRVPVFERDWRVPLKKELGVEWRLDPTHETEYTLESFAEEMLEANLTVAHLEVRWGEIWAEVASI
ncbi:MAG: class I SAM-dependent methyltransferase [Anaerolineales bacterium]|nr:class I SAM-dependent methyltransferase [Anaerolineales bacterium]